MTPRRAITGALVAAVAVPGVYLALGGGSYMPSGVADPCKTRAWTSPANATQLTQQLASSALDGAACTLGVSREELTLALADSDGRARFARRHHLDDAGIERAVRIGLVRAVDDAEKAGAVGGLRATLLRAAAGNLPVERLLGLIQDGQDLPG